MNDKDTAVGTAIFVGGMGALNKLSHKKSPITAMFAAFFLGLFILVGAKVSPQGARIFAVVVCTTAFLVNGDILLQLVAKLAGTPDPFAAPTPYLPGQAPTFPSWVTTPVQPPAQPHAPNGGYTSY